MDADPPEIDPSDPIRARVLDALSLIASEERMGVIRPDLPPGRMAYLLCTMWFDEVYVPGSRYMDGIKGDRDEAEGEAFLSRFDEDERRWLERFHRFLELRVDRLTEQERADGVFPSGEPWAAVVRDAGYLVDLLGGNPREGRALAEAMVRLLG